MLQPHVQALYTIINKQAKELEEADRRGDPPPAHVEFFVVDQCNQCRCEISPPKKSMTCSACKAILYCGSKCAKVAWSVRRAPLSPTHKELCADNKRHMERLPETRALLESFPWGRLEKDYTFSVELARARFNVLGGTGTGFWSFRGGPAVHQNEGDGRSTRNDNISIRGFPRTSDYQHLDGHDLLHQKTHLTDEKGWRLDPKLIPYRDMSKIPHDRQPCLITEFEGGVKDWDSWYRWRKLPKRSPAALLMSYPLSVYQLLVHVLKLTSLDAGKPHARVALCVHMLGAEVELNYLPLFSELALLLPYHDITLLLWGPSVHRLVQEASQQGVAGSPLRKSLKNNGQIFDYAAPDSLGSGTLKIILHADAPEWARVSMAQLHDARRELFPDALVALNAGLASYASWMEVITMAHLAGVPFAVTEYAEQSLEHAVRQQLRVAMTQPPRRQHDIALNPFQRPGQRQQASIRLPSLVNGFTMVVVGRT